MTMDERKFQGFLYLICGAIWIANGIIELFRRELIIKFKDNEEDENEKE